MWRPAGTSSEQVREEFTFTQGRVIVRGTRSMPSTAPSRRWRKGQQRMLLVMATGTGKTYTAFQIIWRCGRPAKKRILFLADRNILVDQTKNNDFKPFGAAMTKITSARSTRATRSTSRCTRPSPATKKTEHLQAVLADFFDLIVIDECHRGSAAEDSAWREILDYFSSATHLGPDRHAQGNQGRLQHHYFGEPGLHLLAEAGHRGRLPRALQGGAHRPRQRPAGLAPDQGQGRQERPADRRPHLQPARTWTARWCWRSAPAGGQKITGVPQGHRPFAKTIVFCDDIDHAERMRQAW
jgi:type I restriction enzyme R subunit